MSGLYSYGTSTPGTTYWKLPTPSYRLLNTVYAYQCEQCGTDPWPRSLCYPCWGNVCRQEYLKEGFEYLNKYL